MRGVIKMDGVKVGIVTHYYEKIKVAIISVESDLKVGDKIKFVRGGEDLFEQIIDSMQVEHKNIDPAIKGNVIGLKVENEVKEGAEVYRV